VVTLQQEMELEVMVPLLLRLLSQPKLGTDHSLQKSRMKSDLPLVTQMMSLNSFKSKRRSRTSKKPHLLRESHLILSMRLSDGV
jgi:hypothetical protein